MELMRELLALAEAERSNPPLRDYVNELKLFCKDYHLTLDASQSKFTVWKKFADGKKWMAPFNDAKEAFQWLDMMRRQHEVKNAKLPWDAPN